MNLSTQPTIPTTTHWSRNSSLDRRQARCNRLNNFFLSKGLNLPPSLIRNLALQYSNHNELLTSLNLEFLRKLPSIPPSLTPIILTKLQS